MTYVPVESPRGGRPAMPIPPSLLAQLEHSAATGARCEIDLTPEDSADDVAELRRALVRAGYRHFPNHTINKRFSPERVAFWVTPKRKPPAKKAGRKARK